MPRPAFSMRVSAETPAWKGRFSGSLTCWQGSIGIFLNRRGAEARRWEGEGLPAKHAKRREKKGKKGKMIREVNNMPHNFWFDRFLLYGLILPSISISISLPFFPRFFAGNLL